MQSTSWETLDWKKHKLESRNINNLRYTDDTTFTAESEKELKSLLMKVKAGWKLNIQKTKIKKQTKKQTNKQTKIVASGPITSWEIDGETTVTDFILGAPKSLRTATAAMKLKDACFLEEKLWPT